MLKGLIFDLDGTLTLPGQLDFDKMRRAIGCPAGETILEYLGQLALSDPQAYDRALAEVDRQEREAAANVQPAVNLEPFMAWLQDSRLLRAIITRNSRATALVTLELLGLSGRFHPVVAREDAVPKPAPDGVLMILEAWGIAPGEAMVVGDFKYDIEAGAAAGTRTVLYTGSRPVLFPHQADFVVDDLLEIPPLAGPRLPT